MVLVSGQVWAGEYVSDPSVAAGGDGSKANPWPSLEACIAGGQLRQLQGGDTLYLLTGTHGTASISGHNADLITIAAAPGHEARLSRLTLDDADQWRIKGLRISPTFGTPYGGNIVSFCDRAETSGQVIIEDCEVFAVDDHHGLNAKQWMGLNSGILMGRHGKGSVVRNCYIRNTRFALALTAYEGVAEGNIIENFSADGIRMTRDGERAEYNLIKGAFVSDSDGDANHDDAIQCFLFNKGTGTMRNLNINFNILRGLAPGVEPLAAVNQGIGLFDGPLVDFHIEGNVVMVSHWHGVSVYDGQDCKVLNNVTWTDYPGKLRPWVMLGTKLHQAKNNTVTGNYAMSFNLKQPGTTEADNKTVSKEIYERSLADLSAIVCEKFGTYHRASMRHRLTGVHVDSLPDDPKSGKDAAATSIQPKDGARQLKPGQREIFQQQLQARLDARVATTPTHFVYSVFAEEVTVHSKTGTTYDVDIPKMHAKITVDLFADLKPADALNLARSLNLDQDEAGNALVAFYCLLTGNGGDASFFLARAGAGKEAVLAAFEGSQK